MQTTLAERVAAALLADEYAFSYDYTTDAGTHMYKCLKRSLNFGGAPYMLEVDGGAVVHCTCYQCRTREVICKHEIIFALTDHLLVGPQAVPVFHVVDIAPAVAARFYTNSRPALGQVLEAQA